MGTVSREWVCGIAVHGGTPRPHGEYSCSPQHLGEHYIVMPLIPAFR